MSIKKPYDRRWEGYRVQLLVPRTDPDSWKNEQKESSPGVPSGSKLIGIPIRDLESNYGVQIEVLEGNQEILSEYSGLYVRGVGSAVQEFFDDLLTTT